MGMQSSFLKKEKILVLGPSLSAVSGVSTHVTQLLSSRLGEQYELHHFQIGSEGRKENYFQRSIRLLFSPASLAGALIINRIDLIHINSSTVPKAFWRDAVYALVARCLGRKVVFQMHGGLLPEEFAKAGSVSRYVFLFVLRRVNMVVVLGRKEYESYSKFRDIASKCALIPNGVRIEPVTPKTIAGPEAVLRLGYIGRLHVEKGLFELLDALASLACRGDRSFKCILAGSGESEGALKARVVELGLERYVRFTGALFAEKKAEFWRNIDVLVFPSYAEGMPYSILESLASGTPVIATRVGAIPDVIQDAVHGWLVPARDAQAIADAIGSLLSNRAPIAAMSPACIERALAEYSTGRLAERIGYVYRVALSLEKIVQDPA